MTGEKNKNLIYIGIIGAAVVVIVGSLFVYLNNRIEKLEKIVTQLPEIKERVVPPEKIPPAEEIRKEEERAEEKIPKSWKEVTTFIGTESQKTGSFYIPTDEWKLIWELESYPQKIGYFEVKIFGVKDNRLIDSPSRSIIPGEGIYSEPFFYYQGKDSFYFDVIASDLKSWKIKVEEAE